MGLYGRRGSGGSIPRPAPPTLGRNSKRSDEGALCRQACTQRTALHDSPHTPSLPPRTNDVEQSPMHNGHVALSRAQTYTTVPRTNDVLGVYRPSTYKSLGCRDWRYLWGTSDLSPLD